MLRNEFDYRVGFAATTVLEELALEAAREAWTRRDLPVFVEYAVKYDRLREYKLVQNYPEDIFTTEGSHPVSKMRDLAQTALGMKKEGSS